MARKTKASGQDTDPKGPVLIEEAVQDPVEIADPVPDNATASAADIPDDTNTTGGAAETDGAVMPETVPADDVSATDISTELTPEPEPDNATPPEPDRTETPPEPAPFPVSAPPQVTVQKVGFVPLVLGGAIAAALGFGAAVVFYGQQGADLTVTIAAQATQISALEAQVAALPTDMPDLAPVAARIDAMESSLGTQLTELGSGVTAQIAAFDDRLTGVERAPGIDGTLAATAIASWETELDTLRAEIAAQQTRMGDIATDAEAELEASRAAAAQIEQNAAEAADQAVVRAALARIQVALDSGMPFDAALSDLAETGATPPPELAAVAADGVPTIGTLREGFPDVARAALAAARADGVADVDTNPVTAFLRNQFDVRSVTPREGDDPDAILSRVNAALNENRLTDALAEIEGLPEVARAEMQGWIDQARARTAAAAAVETLDQYMNN